MISAVLSLDAINAHSPYTVSYDAVRDVYAFTTDAKVEIGITFEIDTILTKGRVFLFSINNLNRKKSPRDSKIRHTITAIVEEFFAKNEAAMLYICETGDGKQAMRSRLFEFWFSIYRDREEFVFIPLTVKEEEGVEDYTALVIRKDNPNFADIVIEFTNLVNLLNTKPQYDD